MNLIRKYYDSFIKNAPRRAFRVNNADYSYQQFFELVNGSRELIEASISGFGNRVGVVCSGDIETYAAIFAIWFSGNCFVPINPAHPLERNRLVLQKTGVKYVFSAKPAVGGIIDSEEITLLVNFGKTSATAHLPVETPETRLMYILTTSGSTGEPKQVPINLKNVEAYCRGFLKLFPELSEEDGFLQTYDLTSDAAFTGYLLPLLVGGCVYTLPQGPFKFLTIARLLTDSRVSWVKMTPSVLTYLDPYISQLNYVNVKHVVFGGEALPVDLIKRWAVVFANADISNLYGPTETTISATTFRFSGMENVKTFDGIISIGKPFPDVECIIIDESGKVLEGETKGELCIGGNQTMKGYLNPAGDCFYKMGSVHYYRTGDLVYRDREGFLYFLGRLDDQVKIDGYRVSLLEIENAARSLFPRGKVAAVIFQSRGLSQIVLFVEANENPGQTVQVELSKKLPPQMVPHKVIMVKEIPLTTSGKTDRKKLRNDYL